MLAALTSLRQLTINQFATFAGRQTFWIFRLPGGNTRSTEAYWALCTLSGAVFLFQAVNSSWMTSSPASDLEAFEKNVLYGPMGVIILAGLQSLFGGIVFCNTYWKVMNKPLPPGVYKALDKARAAKELHKGRAYAESIDSVDEAIGLLDGAQVAEPGEMKERGRSEETALREFLLSTIAPPDVISVTVASLVGMAIQGWLCQWQVMNGRDLCLQR